jgi:hypothetical protein
MRSKSWSKFGQVEINRFELATNEHLKYIKKPRILKGLFGKLVQAIGEHTVLYKIKYNPS